jgi:thiosulfate dehydrogenase
MRKTGLFALPVLAALAIGWSQIGADTDKPAGQNTSAAQPISAADFAAMQAATAKGIDPATMSQWKRGDKAGGENWVAEELAKHKVTKPVDNNDLIGKGQGSTYGNVTKHDVTTWDRETYKAAVEGSRIFHDTQALGSKIGVSCDNCHPDAANTHPETYPKFQVQLGRVALLRDMINWCIENPVKGKVLAPDSHKMRALESYIYAQRKGTPLAYGKR